ncbi:unnamed protein product [Macrosiphum euphorbiae]|uniref:Peptidase S1 domain-containing protein n=1 Tax=Macrosiphum euphorbiae TaxID=13131 RepID=A0AAV0VIH2_9HEMI|nr:unnamed protein product [Macrosiphum euphorbiae]
MKSLKSLQCIFMLFILCFVHLGYCAPQNKDNVTNTTSNWRVDQSNDIETYSASENDVTNTTSNWRVDQSNDIETYSASENDVTNTTSNWRVHQFNDIETYSAAEMCSNYSQLIYKYIKDSTLSDDKDVLINCKDCYNNYPSNISTVVPNVNDERVAPREFLHTALLGDSNGIWLYSGSLISNRWILSVAHFERIFYNLTCWARLRDPNYSSETDDVTPMDYQIDQIEVHPGFQMPLLYNDIALFHLDRDVQFSSYVRPICLNADPNWQWSHSQTVIAPGWGRIQYVGPLNAFSSGLSKVSLDIVSAEKCKSNYKVSSDTPQLIHGIDEDRIICAGVVDSSEDTCVGFGGSSLQIPHAKYTFMYTQVGISSAGKERCATKDFPYFYTRVSKYLPWIERIVWPKSG